MKPLILSNIFLWILFNNSFSQSKIEKSDYVKEFFRSNQQFVIDSMPSFETDYFLKRRDAKKISKIFLINRIGRFPTLMRLPLVSIKYFNYWMFLGRKGKIKKRNSIQIVINAKTGCVEYFMIGK